MGKLWAGNQISQYKREHIGRNPYEYNKHLKFPLQDAKLQASENLYRREFLECIFQGQSFIQNAVFGDQKTHSAKKLCKDSGYELYSMHSVLRKLTLQKSSGSVMKMWKICTSNQHLCIKETTSEKTEYYKVCGNVSSKTYNRKYLEARDLVVCQHKQKMR